MNNNLIQELQNAITMLKKEINEKQKKLKELTNQYQELSGIKLYDEENNDDLTEIN